MDDQHRIGDHPVLGSASGSQRVTFRFNGQLVDGWAADTIASALWAAGIRALGVTPGGDARGLACGIGHCFACRVTVDGLSGVRACLVQIQPGMDVNPDREDGEGADAG